MPNYADPRAIITADAFSVDPQLLGKALAPPRRRAVALLIDLMLVGLVTVLTSGFWFVLGVVVAVFFFSRARKRGKGDRMSTVFRLFLGGMAMMALLMTITTFVGLRLLSDRIDEDAATGFVFTTLGDTIPIDLPGGLDDALPGLSEGVQIVMGASPEEVVEQATRLARRLEETGTLDEVEEVLAELIPDEVGGVDGERLLEQVVANLAAPTVGVGESELTSDTAVEAAAREAERERAEVMALAADTITQLQDRLDQSERDLERTEAELEGARASTGLFGWLADRADSFGFGLGWWTMYFAVLMPRMKGQTPGKRAMGIRVVRLDGQPVTWWHAFERAGGYTAGLATGLLGFAQIYWDPNRQAIHDKIAGTAVTLDRTAKLPGQRDLAGQGPPQMTTET